MKAYMLRMPVAIDVMCKFGELKVTKASFKEALLKISRDFRNRNGLEEVV